MGKTYACADLHGCLWAWNKIKQILQPEDTLYFLGDAIDRGEHGYTIMQELLTDSRVIYIRGNHETMMYDYYCEMDDTWHYNGNYPTMKEISEYHLDHHTFNLILDTIIQLPVCIEYVNTDDMHIFMSHSGYCNNKQLGDEEDYIWNRTHFFLDNDVPVDTIVIHGHTPIPLLRTDLGEPYSEVINDVYWYSNNKKCCIDMGTVWTDVCALIDLDTLEPIIMRRDADSSFEEEQT